MEHVVYAYVDTCTWHVGLGPAVMDQKLIAMSETNRLASLISNSSGDPFVPQRTSGYSQWSEASCCSSSVHIRSILIVLILTPNSDPLTFLLNKHE